jgi:succinoglycan biosynthesis protein ExoM
MNIPLVSICICTYKRAALLDSLLQRLQELHEIERVGEIVVVDNDPLASARATLKTWRGKSKLPIVSLHVPNPNISLARNAAVHAATGDWVAMIDDDELPEHGWILELLKAQRDFNADVVHGPVLPVYAHDAPTWILQGGFFMRPRHPTGTPLVASDFRTGNALVRRSQLLQITGPFDEAFGRSGGEDTVLFKQLLTSGSVMVWSDDAIVHEFVPPERATLAWLTRRSFQTGQIGARTGRFNKGWRTASYCLRRVSIDFALFLLLLMVSKARAVRRLRSAALFAGALYALLGFRHDAYGR